MDKLDSIGRAIATLALCGFGSFVANLVKDVDGGGGVIFVIVAVLLGLYFIWPVNFKLKFRIPEIEFKDDEIKGDMK